MAHDMVEMIRTGLSGWSAGDLDQARADLDPEMEFVTSGVFPGLDHVYRGHEGFARFFTDFRGAWDDIAIEVERIVPGRSPLYVVVGNFRATARDGLHVERPVTIVVTAAGDTIQRMESFADRDEAFAAAGATAA